MLELWSHDAFVFVSCGPFKLSQVWDRPIHIPTGAHTHTHYNHVHLEWCRQIFFDIMHESRGTFNMYIIDLCVCAFVEKTLDSRHTYPSIFFCTWSWCRASASSVALSEVLSFLPHGEPQGSLGWLCLRNQRRLGHQWIIPRKGHEGSWCVQFIKINDGCLTNAQPSEFPSKPLGAFAWLGNAMRKAPWFVGGTLWQTTLGSGTIDYTFARWPWNSHHYLPSRVLSTKNLLIIIQ